MTTSDGGATWNDSPVSSKFSFAWSGHIAVDPADADVAYASLSYYHELYRTLDGGRSWELLDCCAINEPASSSIMGIEVVGGEVHVATVIQGVFSSADRGETWTNRSVGMVPLPRIGYGQWFHEIYELAADPWSGGLAAVTWEYLPEPWAWRSQVYRSTPHALAWKRTEPFREPCGSACWWPFYDLRVAGPEILYIGENGYEGCDTHAEESEVFRSLDGGSTWESAAGLGGSLAEFLPGDTAGEVLAATCEGGIFVSQGQGWSPFAEGPPSDQRLAFDRGPDGRIWAATLDGLFVLDA